MQASKAEKAAKKLSVRPELKKGKKKAKGIRIRKNVVVAVSGPVPLTLGRRHVPP